LAFRRKAIDEAAGFGEQDIPDVFTEAARGIDKTTWSVESHLNRDYRSRFVQI
jgi:hypothetical protein